MVSLGDKDFNSFSPPPQQSGGYPVFPVATIYIMKCVCSLHSHNQYHISFCPSTNKKDGVSGEVRHSQLVVPASWISPQPSGQHERCYVLLVATHFCTVCAYEVTMMSSWHSWSHPVVIVTFTDDMGLSSISIPWVGGSRVATDFVRGPFSITVLLCVLLCFSERTWLSPNYGVVELM